MRELEEEIEALAVGKAHRRKLKELMNKKELVGDLFNNLRLTRQRLNNSARVNSSTLEAASGGSSAGTASSSESKEQNGDGWQVGFWVNLSTAATDPDQTSGSVCFCEYFGITPQARKHLSEYRAHF